MGIMEEKLEATIYHLEFRVRGFGCLGSVVCVLRDFRSRFRLLGLHELSRLKEAQGRLPYAGCRDSADTVEYILLCTCNVWRSLAHD